MPPSHWIALLENSAGIAQLESAIAAADHDIADLGRKGSQTATEWGGGLRAQDMATSLWIRWRAAGSETPASFSRPVSKSETGMDKPGQEAGEIIRRRDTIWSWFADGINYAILPQMARVNAKVNGDGDIGHSLRVRSGIQLDICTDHPHRLHFLSARVH